MTTLTRALGSLTEGLVESPRVYGDANLPAGLVRFMRDRLKWNVFFVMEEEDLRRASEVEHFQLAAQLRRTLVTLGRDYLDDLRFPLNECGGVLVLSAPDEEQLQRLLTQVDRVLFQQTADKRSSGHGSRMPLFGRKLHVQTDWTGELE